MLLPDLEGSHFYPSWSPVMEVNHLAYVREDEDGGQDLWVVELGSGAEPRNLTGRRLSGIEAPRWSPDGTRIAVSATERTGAEPSEERRTIYVIDVVSSTATRVEHGIASDIQPVWSPDGSSLLVTSVRPAADAGRGQRDLWQIPLRGATPPMLVLSTGAATLGSDWYPFAACGNAARAAAP